MRLWKKASGALKDKYSIWVAQLSPYGPFRNPDLETVVIKATSHDEQCMDYKNVQRSFQWLRTSPLYLKPLLYTLSMRMEKTHSWVVALKGLMLIHGVFCFDLPSVQKLGRLPFDLSQFSDGHMHPRKALPYNTFVRSYFAYLDQKSTFVRLEAMKVNRRGNKETEETVMEELRNLEKLQGLIDLLLQIKPKDPRMNVVLVLEAMDCLMDEVLEVYGKFCKGVRGVLMKVFDVGGKEEARVCLEVVRKTELQGDKLSFYFEFCRQIGAIRASECPPISRIDNKDVDELERMLNDEKNAIVATEDNTRAIVVRDCSATATISLHNKQLDHNGLTTVITHQWEVFDDDGLIVDVSNGTSNYNPMAITSTNPFADSLSLVPYTPLYNNFDLPDLISL